MDYPLRGNLRWEVGVLTRTAEHKTPGTAHPCENRDLSKLHEIPAYAGMSGEFEAGFLKTKPLRHDAGEAYLSMAQDERASPACR